MSYNKSDLEFLMSFSVLNESHVGTIAKILSKFSLEPTECWVLDSEQELQTLDATDPLEAYAQSMAWRPSRFMFSAKGSCHRDEVEVVAAFDFVDRAISFSMGDRCLLRRGGSAPESRVLFFFEVAREIANALAPVYGFIGPETYSTAELALEHVESTGLTPFSAAEALGDDAHARVCSAYGLKKPL